MAIYWQILLKMEKEVIAIDKEKLLRYSMQLSMLKQLLNRKLITEGEYSRILSALKKDYGVVSHIIT